MKVGCRSHDAATAHPICMIRCGVIVIRAGRMQSSKVLKRWLRHSVSERTCVEDATPDGLVCKYSQQRKASTVPHHWVGAKAEAKKVNWERNGYASWYTCVSSDAVNWHSTATATQQGPSYWMSQHPKAWLGPFCVYLFSAFYILSGNDDDGGDPMLFGVFRNWRRETGEGGVWFYFSGGCCCCWYWLPVMAGLCFAVPSHLLLFWRSLQVLDLCLDGFNWYRWSFGARLGSKRFYGICLSYIMKEETAIWEIFFHRINFL